VVDVKSVSLRELESLTGKHHKFLKQCLESVPFASGPNRTHLYNAPDALAAIYHVTKSLEAARTRLAESAALLNEIRSDELRKTRIPIEIVADELDTIFQAIASILKSEATKHRPLTQARVNEIFDKFRAIPKKWRPRDQPTNSTATACY
jgi:hypothetical protein